MCFIFSIYAFEAKKLNFSVLKILKREKMLKRMICLIFTILSKQLLHLKQKTQFSIRTGRKYCF